MHFKDKILFRDAGVIIPDVLGSIGRIRYCKGLLIGGLCDGMEVTLNDYYFEEEHKRAADELCGLIEDFECIVFHLDSKKNRYGDNLYTKEIADKLRFFKRHLKNLQGIVVHPDLIDDFSGCRDMKFSDAYFAVEVLGKGFKYGASIKDIESILETHEFCDLVLDIAHVEENISEGGAKVMDYIESFGNRIPEVHLSLAGNFYQNQIKDRTFNTSHSLLCLGRTGADGLYDFSGLNSPLNYVIEGVLPPGKYEKEFLKKELDLVEGLIKKRK